MELEPFQINDSLVGHVAAEKLGVEKEADDLGAILYEEIGRRFGVRPKELTFSLGAGVRVSYPLMLCMTGTWKEESNDLRTEEVEFLFTLDQDGDPCIVPRDEVAINQDGLSEFGIAYGLESQTVDFLRELHIITIEAQAKLN